MNKPDSLRARISAMFPELQRNPQRLRLWIEQGNVQCHGARDNLNYRLRYRLTVVIEGWRESSLLIWIALLDWLRVHQPELLTPERAKDGIVFEADLISAEECDVSFDLWLDEAVRVVARPDGGFDMQLLDEPDPMFPDAEPILENRPLLEQLWAHGQQLIPNPWP